MANISLDQVHGLPTEADASRARAVEGRDRKRRACGVVQEIWYSTSFGFIAPRESATPAAECACLTNLGVTAGTESDRTESREVFCASKASLRGRPVSSELFKSISPFLSLWFPSWDFHLITFEEEPRGADNGDEHLSVSASSLWKALELPVA